MRLSLSRRSKRAGDRENERGTELVELTLVFPLLIFLVMGMLDAGVAFKTKLEVVQATRQAARIGSAFGDDDFADQEALLAALSVVPDYVNIGPDNTNGPRLDFIVFYRADAADGNPTTACRSGSVSNLCLHMTRAEVEAFITSYEADPLADPPHAVREWDNRPDDPENLLSLGVYMEATQPSFTGVFNSLTEWNVDGKTVMRTEPLID